LLKQYEDPHLPPTAQVGTRCLKPGELPQAAPQPAFIPPRMFPKPDHVEPKLAGEVIYLKALIVMIER
jgi:hypothetical protein